ncbi:peptidoglycan-associated lipoprotein [Sulfurimicrobium lacus]|uniref:Peptidoglycan-associated lipoprotein n=1 Tax=Sulfurimicrobium lacus TaxID=2715678 RepID=A0A6F8VEC4_9PROT|nr:peptidoglycan-associated lipoprotein Pal [Sulfurimicrobium lacus]BCB27447.1 peptidoglycan-associated lipoprotein [Sulfurimicrobium lacus]
MNKFFLGIIAFSVLTGCASQSATEQPKPVISNAAAQKGSETVAPLSISVNPLKDPNNILSKRSIYYDFDSSVVKNEFKRLIEAHAKYLTAHPDAKVTVQGNTDERGSREYNIALGDQRAESVRKMMKVLGVPDKQIEAVSFGKEKPKANCHDESCWKANRRSDLVYQGEQ